MTTPGDWSRSASTGWMRSSSHQKICRIPVIPGVGVRLTGMTIHRLMTAMASEQGRTHGDEQVVEATTQTTDDRGDAAAEQ